jgi:hypothetical protein
MPITVTNPFKGRQYHCEEWAMAGGSTLLALPFESERNIGLF